MAKTISVPVYDETGKKLEEKVSLKPSVFGVEPNGQVMFDAVQVYQSNLRQATAKTKIRSEVSGGGKKPWRQKGTGRARAGSSRSPIWVGGGTVFGPTGEQSFKKSQNNKAPKLALKSALSSKVNDGLKVVTEFKVNDGKTKEFVKFLKALDTKKKVLIVVDELNNELLLGARNIKGMVIAPYDNVSVYDLLNATDVLMSKAALVKIEEVLG